MHELPFSAILHPFIIISCHDTADLALSFSLEPCVTTAILTLQESIQRIDQHSRLYSYKQCSEYQIWVVDTSSCSGMKGTTTTMMTGTSRPGDTLSILSSYARARNHTHEYYVLGSEALPKSCHDPSFSFKQLLVLYHLCYNSFSKTKIVNTAS